MGPEVWSREGASIFQTFAMDLLSLELPKWLPEAGSRDAQGNGASGVNAGAATSGVAQADLATVLVGLREMLVGIQGGAGGGNNVGPGMVATTAARSQLEEIDVVEEPRVSRTRRVKPAAPIMPPPMPGQETSSRDVEDPLRRQAERSWERSRTQSPERAREWQPNHERPAAALPPWEAHGGYMVETPGMGMEWPDYAAPNETLEWSRSTREHWQEPYVPTPPPPCLRAAEVKGEILGVDENLAPIEVKVVGMIANISDENDGALVPMAPAEVVPIPRPVAFEFFNHDTQIPLKIFLRGMAEFHQRMLEAGNELGTLMHASMQENLWNENLGRLLSHSFG